MVGHGSHDFCYLEGPFSLWSEFSGFIPYLQIPAIKPYLLTFFKGSKPSCRPFLFFFFLSSTYIAVYSKQSAQYSKLHLFIPDGHEEDSKFARITLRAGVDESVNHRHVNMRGR